MLWGAVVIVTVSLVFCALLMLRTKVDGVLGEWATLAMGVLTTPFLMEGFFIIAGFMLVVWINHLRRKRAGDEFVDLSDFSGEEEGGVRDSIRKMNSPGTAEGGNLPG